MADNMSLLKTLHINKIINLQEYPFRLLLYLEWILLTILMLVQFRLLNMPKPLVFDDNHTINPAVLLFIIACFGIMGFRLPMGNLISKIVYTVIELLLIFLVSIAGGQGNGFSAPLLLILAIRSCFIFNKRGSLLVTSLAWTYFILNLATSGLPTKVSIQQQMFQSEEAIRNIFWAMKINISILFSLVLIFVLLLVNALVAERQSRQKLTYAHEQLRQYSLRIEDQATLQERNRIAREIHDALGHSLMAQSIQLENALTYLELNIDKTKEFLLEAKQLGANILKDVRNSVAKLRSDPLQGKSLETAISNLLAEFQSRTDITPDYSLYLKKPLPPEVKKTVFRIVQEALTNIYKHSEATEIIIDINTSPDLLTLRIEDNGVGFDPSQNTTGFGLQGMRERAVVLGGQVYITSEPGSGCNIMACIPLSRLQS
jgi:signal transduction histidine kinase